MCRAVRCRTCGLVTWAGCGEHADQVLATVPREQRCAGHERSRSGEGWLDRLRRR